jgi:hypothetical protein
MTRHPLQNYALFHIKVKVGPSMCGRTHTEDVWAQDADTTRLRMVKLGVKVQLYYFFNLGSRCRRVVVTARPLYPRECPGIHCTEGWVGPRTGLDGCGKFRLRQDSMAVCRHTMRCRMTCSVTKYCHGRASKQREWWTEFSMICTRFFWDSLWSKSASSRRIILKLNLRCGMDLSGTWISDISFFFTSSIA